MTTPARNSATEPEAVRFSRISQFETISDAFVDGCPQIVVLALPADVARLAVAFLLGLTTGGGGELQRLADGSYLVLPGLRTDLADNRVDLAA